MRTQSDAAHEIGRRNAWWILNLPKWAKMKTTEYYSRGRIFWVTQSSCSLWVMFVLRGDWYRRIRPIVQLQYHSFDKKLVSPFQPIYGKSLIHQPICWPISWTKSPCVFIFYVDRRCIWQILMTLAFWLGTLSLSRHPKYFLSNPK